MYGRKYKILIKEIKKEFLKCRETYHVHALEDAIYEIHPN